MEDNPYAAAQRFLEKNDLPLTYLDEVVKFIEKNTEGVKLGGGSEFVDPYTGQERLVSCFLDSYLPISELTRCFAVPSISEHEQKCWYRVHGSVHRCDPYPFRPRCSL